jgi:mono/diheme cytochrome c family protein
VLARTGLALLLLGIPGVFAQQDAIDPLTKHGESLARSLCSECHAIARSDQSPHPRAPLFRELGRRLDLDSFSDRLRDQLMVDHPDMPSFRFTREDARALVFYLRSIQAP